MDKCPHCKGEIKSSSSSSYNYVCRQCGRGWRIDKEGNWHALFDAGMHIYDKHGNLISYAGRPTRRGER